MLREGNRVSLGAFACGAAGRVLGRGLINAQPQAYGRKLDECKIVGREFVVAGCHTPTVLDLVEEPLDQVASPVKIRTEA